MAWCRGAKCDPPANPGVYTRMVEVWGERFKLGGVSALFNRKDSDDERDRD